ncbi:MAG: hypothetical protein IJ658_05240 [Kiritimatiellae bacterium]|nr:hypothetical protein [Kiritimatiellia bacterium]
MKRTLLAVSCMAFGACALQAEDGYLESSGGTGINSRYFFNPKSRIEVDYALTDASIQQARVWGMDITAPMASLYVQGTLNVAFGSGDTFVNSDTLTGLRADTLRHTAILDVAQRQAVYMTGAATNWSNLSILATHAPSTTATIPISIFAGTKNNVAGTLFDNCAKMKLYRIRFFTDGELVHDYLPCVKGGVPGLRDQVDGVFVTSENVGALSVGGDVETIEDDPWIALPDNNQTNGWQFVNTGYRPTPNTRFEVDFALLKNYTESLSGNGDWAVFSAYSTQSNNASTANYSVFNFYYNKGGAGWSCGGDNWIALGAAFPKPVDDKDIRRMAVLDAKNKTFVLTTAGFTNYTGTCAGFRDFDYKTAKIGAWYQGQNGFAPLKIYGCRIFEDDVLVRDLRPCVQNGLAGLKDEVDDEFMACGTRTYGGPIPHEQGDGYIESKTRNCFIDTGYYANSNTCVWADWAFTSRDNASAAGGQHFVYEINNNGLVSRIYGNGTDKADTHYSWTFSKPAKWTDTGIVVVTNVRHQAYIDSYGDQVAFMSGAYTNYATAMSTLHMTNHVAVSNSQTLKLFSNAGGTANFALMRLYGFKIWESGTLVRDYIPYIRNGAAGLYDRVNGTFLSGNRSFAYGGDIASDGSSMDAYVESTGEQAISTGYAPNGSTRIEADTAFTYAAPAQARAWGLANTSLQSAELYINGSGLFSFGYQTAGNSWKAQTFNVAADIMRHLAVLDIAQSKYAFDGEDTALGSQARNATADRPLALFGKAGNVAGTTFSNLASMRLYTFRIYEYENGEKKLKHEYLPYKKGNVIGLYDTVDKVVKTDALSSGTPFKIGGKGVDGAERWIVAPQGARLSKRTGTATLSANAAGAVSYRWTRNGEPVAGGKDGDLTVEWEKAKSGTTETYDVIPVYDVCGNATEGEPVPAAVEFIADGTVLVVR